MILNEDFFLFVSLRSFLQGYMLSNADYRLSLSQSLGMPSHEPESDDDEVEASNPLSGKVCGKIRIRYRNRSSDADSMDRNENSASNADSDVSGGLEVEVDAAAYLSELRTEVSQLRNELTTARKAKDDALRKDLLLYIRTLPKKELLSLTSTMSPDVLVAMKGLVKAVLAGIGEGQIGPETITEQSAEAMAQLCLWQLAIGYNLRRLEVREEMKKSLQTSNSELVGSDSFEAGIDFSSNGGFE
jgi:hypothetical protein